VAAQRILCLQTHGRWLGFPLRELRCLRDWEEPHPLPGGVEWLAGWIPYEGHVVPLVDPAAFVEDGRPPEGGFRMVLMLCFGGVLIGIPGERAYVTEGREETFPEAQSGPWSGMLRADEDREVRIVDFSLLYTVLSVRYNENGRNRG